MDLGSFSDRKTGQLVPVAGVQGATHAFVPNPLPPAWTWPEELWPVLMRAHKALAALDGIGAHLPNAQLLLKPLQNREAQRSSRLEGTITDPQEQVLFEADPKYPESEGDPKNAFREVFNYGQALQLRKKSLSDLPLSLRLIRELHAVLMDGVRGAHKDPGRFRRLQNQIGRPPRFVPPPVAALGDALDAFEKFMHADTVYDPLVKAFLVHYQFEAIHPFADGNGRTGRLLLALTIQEWTPLTDQWLYMSPYFELHKDQYTDLMLRVSKQGDWTSWIRFCLEGVAKEAIDTRLRCEMLLAKNREFHTLLEAAGGSVRLSAIVDALFERPVVRVTEVADRFSVTYPTARADLKKLHELGIVVQLEGYKPITYYSAPVYEITFAD